MWWRALLMVAGVVAALHVDVTFGIALWVGAVLWVVFWLMGRSDHDGGKNDGI